MEDAEIPDYEKKRLENIAEKKAMFEDKLRNAKLAVKEKRFQCSKCLSDFMKKAQLKSHQCIKCDICIKYFKTTQRFYNHDRVEHDGHFAIKSKLKRPERKKKNVSRYEPDEFEENKCAIEKLLDMRFQDFKDFRSGKFPGQKSNKKQYLVKWKGFENEQNTWESRKRIPRKLIESFEEEQRIKNQSLQTGPNGNQNELEEKLYVIEKLLEKRYLWNIRCQYLVKWKGYGNEDNTWEPKASLPRKVVNRFEKELQNERRAMRNKLREDGKQGDVKIGCSETDK